MTYSTHGFASLHDHSEYSLLDGHSRIKDIVAKAKEYNMVAAALTDHGNMFGAVEFYKECKKAGIKPIIGCEVYQAARTVKDKESVDRKSNHLTLLCRNETGYRNLAKLVSDSYSEENFYYKPRIDIDMLKEHHEGLICLSGCMAGRIPSLLLEGRYDEAKETALDMQSIFGEDCFYLEVQNHGTSDDKKALRWMKRLGEETGIPFVATNDSHYVEKEDAKAQEVLLCINTKATINESHKFAFPSEEFYFKSPEDMEFLFRDFPGACSNTGKIAEMCNFDFEFGNYHIPPYETEDGDTEGYFRRLCEERFNKRYPDATDELKERLDYEINTIINMGYVEYFLIVFDYINYARNNGISVGPGRGSAAGSIVAYSLGITDIEPTRYNLIFERFLNPERVSMPDIDTDFCILRRNDVIRYVTEKYGSENVCKIATIDRQMAKAAVKNVARVYEMPYEKANALTKLMGDDIRSSFDIPEFKKQYDTDRETRTVVDMAMHLEGLATSVSTHAAGVVIASEPVNHFVPLVRTDKGVATQYTMVEDEELGLLKYDFLGLRNLTAIDECIRLVKERTGTEIRFDADSPLDDAGVYKMLSKGDTMGVFQLESKGITGFMKRLKPTCFEDIVAGIALYRPGPMDSIPEYLKNKKNPKKIKYLTPQLEPILSVTYGCIVYQEQVMQIVRDLAGYSFGRSDLVRRAMSKKKHDVMMKEREYFINGKLDDDGNIEIPGCIRNGISKEAAEKIFDEMTSFASYAFNKSHAAAYAVITYRTAWLKHHYPSEFLAALMTSEATKKEHLALYIQYAKTINKKGKREKIKVLPPNIRHAKAHFSVTEDGDIRFGLNAINGIGERVALAIENSDMSEAKNLRGCLGKLPIDIITTKTVENLIKAGALTEITNIATALRDYETVLKDLKKEEKTKGQVSLMDLFQDFQDVVYEEKPPAEEISDEQRLIYEKEALGTYISGHPLEKYMGEHDNSSDIQEKEGESICLPCMITGNKKVVTKSGDVMAFLSAEDAFGEFEVIVFPKLYKKSAHLIVTDRLCLVSGNVEDGKIVAERLSDVTEPPKPKEEGTFYLLVAGSRDFSDYELLRDKLDFFLQNVKKEVCIVSGGAQGADRLAEHYAENKGYQCKVFPADWSLGKSAGYIRNEEMHKFISDKEEKGVVLFWDGKSKGTVHSIELAQKYHNPIRTIRF